MQKWAKSTKKWSFWSHSIHVTARRRDPTIPAPGVLQIPALHSPLHGDQDIANTISAVSLSNLSETQLSRRWWSFDLEVTLVYTECRNSLRIRRRKGQTYVVLSAKVGLDLKRKRNVHKNSRQILSNSFKNNTSKFKNSLFKDNFKLLLCVCELIHWLN